MTPQTFLTRSQIISLLTENHEAFMQSIKAMSDEAMVLEKDGKWSPLQHLDHIIRSVKPLTKGMMLPSFVLRLLFGKANRPSRSYDGLVSRYKEKLANGGKASGGFIPQTRRPEERDAMLRTLRRQCHLLCERVKGFSEEQLDALIAPHPLLGKLTLREMLYFTAYHVRHHQALL